MKIKLSTTNYGSNKDGILGLYFLVQVGAILDLAQLEIRKARRAG